MLSWFSTPPPPTAAEEEARIAEVQSALGGSDTKRHLAAAGRDVGSSLFVRRWMQANKWDVAATLKALETHAVWLQQNSTAVPVEEVELEKVLPNELQQRKLFFQGQDKEGRPVMLFRFSENKPACVPAEERKLGMIWCMEWICKMADMATGANGQITILFDMRNYSMENMDTDTASVIVDVLQRQYPERLGKLLIYDAPTVFWMSWNLIWPFLNAATQSKVSMLYAAEGLLQIAETVPASVLPTDLGGTSEAKFCVHAVEHFQATGCIL